MKPVALECVLGGPCRYKTCKLEFAQAFQLLKLHMKYLHTPKVSDEKVDLSKHDDDSEEDNYEFGELFHDTETRLEDEIDINDPVDEELQSNFADVTLVRDDRDEEDLHPVGNHHPCGSCGRKSHPSHRSSRRRLCPAWNQLAIPATKEATFRRFAKQLLKNMWMNLKHLRRKITMNR